MSGFYSHRVAKRNLYTLTKSLNSVQKNVVEAAGVIAVATVTANTV